MELVPFVMTSGSRGLHVIVPLDRSADFDEARARPGAPVATPLAWDELGGKDLVLLRDAPEA